MENSQCFTTSDRVDDRVQPVAIRLVAVERGVFDLLTERMSELLRQAAASLR